MRNRLLFALLAAAGLLPTLSQAATYEYHKPIQKFAVDSPFPVASFDKTTVNFGTVVAGSSASQSLTVTNTGKVAIPSLTPTFSPSGLFSVDSSSTCGTSLEVGASCALVISAHPTANNVLSNGGSVSLAGAYAVLNGSTFIPSPGSSVSLGTLTFGSQEVGSTSQAQSITLNNTGNVALSVGSISSSGDFSSTHNCQSSLAIGASCTVNTVFSPSGMGPAEGVLTLVTGGGTKTVSLAGTGVEALAAMSPSSFAFGAVLGNSTVTSGVITLANNGNETLNNIVIQAPTGFSVVNSTCGTSLAVGSSCTFKVEFTPNPGQTYNSNLTVTSSGLPQTLALTGSGTVNASGVLSLGTLSFGNVAVGASSAAQSVQLSNNGNVAVSVGQVTTTADYSATTNCPGSLSVGSSCAINTIFSPTAMGANNGTLTIPTSAGTKTVSLTGSGLLTKSSVSVSSLNFGNVQAGATQTSAVVTLSNTGNVGLTGITLTPPAGYSVVNNTCGATLNAGGECMFQVLFSPVAGQAYNGNLTITSNAPSQTIALTGTGLKAVGSLSTTSVPFGTVSVGNSGTSTSITLTNTGNLAMTGLALNAPAGFSVINSTCGTTLAASGGSCTFQIQFTPSAVQAYSDSVTITSNEAAQLAIGVSGTASAATDPYYSKVAMLIHFDGSLPTGVSAAPGVNYTTNGRFGQALDTTNNIAGSTATQGVQFIGPAIGTQDFTIEGWFYTNQQGTPATDEIIAFGSGYGYGFQAASGSAYGGVSYSGLSGCTFNNVFSLKTWTHFAIERSGTNLYLFKNGTLFKTCSGAGASLPSWVWKLGNNSNTWGYNGYLDEFRLTVGVARYPTSGFTAPTSPFPNQ